MNDLDAMGSIMTLLADDWHWPISHAWSMVGALWGHVIIKNVNIMWFRCFSFIRIQSNSNVNSQVVKCDIWYCTAYDTVNEICYPITSHNIIGSVIDCCRLDLQRTVKAIYFILRWKSYRVFEMPVRLCLCEKYICTIDVSISIKYPTVG